MTQIAAPFLADSLDQSKLHFVDVDGIRTRYYEDGTGEPLVLIHGGQMRHFDSLDIWSLNLPGLAQHFHVYALDKLGMGHTDNPKTDADYTWDYLIQHTAAWIRTLGITQAHLVGHSRGGLLAANLAFEVPGLAKSIVIVDSSTLAPVHPASPSGVFYERIDARTPPRPAHPRNRAHGARRELLLHRPRERGLPQTSVGARPAPQGGPGPGPHGRA